MPKGMPKTRTISAGPSGIRAQVGGYHLGDVKSVSRERARVSVGDRVLSKLESKGDATGYRQSTYAGGWGAEEMRERNFLIGLRAERKPKTKKK